MIKLVSNPQQPNNYPSALRVPPQLKLTTTTELRYCLKGTSSTNELYNIVCAFGTTV